MKIIGFKLVCLSVLLISGFTIAQTTINYKDGARYVGKVKNGNYHGKGIYYYANGARTIECPM